MRKKIYPIFTLILVIFVSILITIIPTFFTKNVSRVSLNKEINLPLILNDEKDIQLVFFGYSGCTDICTPRLYALDKFYKDLDDSLKKTVGVAFIDISVPYESTLPNRFATFFNKEFKGIYLNKNILREYTKEFNVYFAPSLSDKTQLDHTNNLYLLKRSEAKKEIRYIYNSYPYDFKQIESDIKELSHE